MIALLVLCFSLFSASGIVAAAKNLDLKIPVVVRLEGTNVQKGKEILKKSGLAIIAADDLEDAAAKSVAAAADYAKSKSA